MSFNTFGHLFRVTTFGESHGPAIGCVVDGCPPRIPLTEADIQPYLDKRRPGPVALHHAAARAGRGAESCPACSSTSDWRAGDHRHADRAPDRQCRPALEGLFATSRTSTGRATPTTPMTSSTASATIAAAAASARETAMRVAAGAIARKIVPGMTVRGALVQMGRHKIDRARWDWDEVERNPFFCPDAGKAEFLEDYLDDIRKAAPRSAPSSRSWPRACRPGSARRSTASSTATSPAALMSINAVKGVEIGAGLGAAALTGEDNADEMRMGNDGRPRVPVQQRRRHPRRHLDRPADRRALRRQADLVDPDAAPHRRPLRRARPRSPPRAATTPASASARCRSARPWWPACSPTIICAIAGRSARRRPGRSRRQSSRAGPFKIMLSNEDGDGK